MTHRWTGRTLSALVAVVVAGTLAAAGPSTASAAYRDTVAATPSLVSHWRLGETTGITAADQQGANAGLYLASPSLGTTGLLTADADTSVTFDGVDDAIKVPNSLSLATSSALTVEAWIKRPASGSPQTLFDKGIYFANMLSGGRMQFAAYVNNSWVQLVSPSNAFLAGSTYHVGFTWDGATMRIYKNGIEIASKPAPGTLSTSYDLIIGADSNGLGPIGEYFAGTIDEIAVYSRALALAEIRQHYAAGVGDTAPPDTTISSGPSGTSQSATAAFGFSSTETGSSFECRLDGGAWSSCTSPKAYSGLAVGAHTFEVRATDAAFNTDPTPATQNWTYELDTTAPETTITSGPPETTGVPRATFAFSSSETGSIFECRLDGGAWSACSSPKSYVGLADGLHSFETRATDASQNLDPTPASRTWTVEISPYASEVRNTAGLVSYWRFGEASGNTAIDETGTKDGQYLGSPGLGADGLLVGDPDSAIGLDKIDDHVKVLDNAGLDTVSGLTWEGWIKPSTVACGQYLFIRSPTALASFGCNKDIRFSIRPNEVYTDLHTPSNAFAAGETYYMAFTWDGATMRIYKNGTEIASRAATGTLANTSYNLIIGAESGGYDARGDYLSGTIDEVALYNRALTGSEVERRYDLGLDPVPPETTINSAPAANSNSSTATFEFTSSEAASTFECRIDGSSWKTCTSPHTYNDLDDGEHGFEVRATDAIGNVDPAPATHDWTISLPPSTPADGLPPDQPADLWVPNGPVNAAVASGHGSIYLGGEFTQIGPYTGHGVALDEEAEPIGTRAVKGDVYAAVPDGNGGWYIGGNFERVGAVVRRRLAHISKTGAVDPDWNPGATAPVHALAFSDGVLYAGGEFTSVGGTSRHRLAAIDTAGAVTSWNPGADDSVQALAVANGNVYVGGTFSTVGGLSRQNLAAVTAGGATTGWNPGADDEVFGLAAANSTVYAGGAFTSVEGQPRNHLAAISAAGTATAWDPSADADVKALAVSDGVVYVGGGFATIDGTSRDNIAAIAAGDGTLKPWNPNVDDDVLAIVPSGDKVYLGGAFTEVGGETRHKLAAVQAADAGLLGWNPSADAPVHALAVSGPTVYAGGEFGSVGGVTRKNLAELDLSTGRASSWDPSADAMVRALELVETTLFVGGDFTSIGGHPRASLAALDADGGVMSWNPGTDGGGPVNALESSGSTLYIGGGFGAVGGQPRYSLAAVDVNGSLTAWNPSADGLVTSLATSGSTVYIGGAFSTIGGEPRSNLAAVNPDGGVTSWNPQPDERVWSIYAADAKLYIGGDFTSIGGEARRGVAELDAEDASATGWNPQPNESVTAVAASGSTVYVGGSFDHVGGADRYSLAALDASSGAATRWNPGAFSAAAAATFVTRANSVYVGMKYGSIGQEPTGRSFAGFVGAPANVSPPSLSAAPVVGETVTTSDGSWYDATAFSYQWLRSGAGIPGATNSSYTPTGEDTSRPLAARVTASNMAGSADAMSDTRVVAGAPVNDTPPGITGTAEVGKILSATDGAWRADPAAEVSRQWRRCNAAGDECVDIDGAQGPAYRALHLDMGKTLRIVVTETNSRGSLTVSSAPTAAIAPTELPVVTLSHEPALSSGWVNSYEDALTVSATDGGPGVAQLEVEAGQGVPREFLADCASQQVACPETLEHVFALSETDLTDGENTITALARDGAGNISDPERYTVRLDRADPTMTTSGALKDAAGQSLDAQESLALNISATDSRAGVRRVEILVDGEQAAQAEQECAAGGCDFERELTVDFGDFDAGRHTITARAEDWAGNTAEESWQLATKDGTPPQITLSGALADAEGESVIPDQSYGLHAVASDGTVEEPQSGVKSIEILVGEERKELVEVPCDDGNCSLEADYTFNAAEFSTGGHTVRVRAVDESGEIAEKTLIVIVHRPPAAPALDDTVATPVEDSIDFIFTGEDPIQTGVAPDVIEDTRAALIRGRVLTEDGAPLPGVEVTVDGHPEFGSTESQADGEVYLAVNGGGHLTLRFSRAADAYLPADRTIDVPWQGYAQFEDVRLLKADPNVQVVDLSGAAMAMQSVAGPTSTDGNGARRPVLLFAPGTYGKAQLEDGSIVPLDGAESAHIRLTEYTVGDAGPESLPGELPTQTAYTYAAEFSVDEAEAQGAQTVRFTDALGAPKPAISYNENFLDFAVGSTVPSGYYDRERGVWVPEDSGRVVKVIGHTPESAAILDVKGTGNAATTAELAELGITDAELAQLGPLYADGSELWRVALSHLTPYDFNMAFYGRPQSADMPPGSPQLAGPGGPDNPNCTSGSIILCETQALGEQVPVAGTPFSLVYQSDRVPGRKSEREVQIPLSDGGLDPLVKRIDLTIEIAGRTIRKSFPDQPNQNYTFKWDGKDEFGRTVQGAQEATVTVSHVYPSGYTTPTRFGSPGRTDEVGEPRAGAGGELTASTTSTVIVSNWDATKLGLGGWTLDAHHAYDPVSRILHRGDGSRQSAQSVNRAMRALAGGDPLSCAPRDGFAARSVSAGRPDGLDMGPDGSLYFASGTNRSVWKVTPEGIIQHVAGVVDCPPYTTPPYSGEGGPATSAQLDRPNDVATDSRGGVYIADESGNRVLYVDSGGTITTVAGNGTAGFGGDGGPATEAQLNRPFSVDLAPDGTLYISDSNNGRIRQVTTDGRIDTFAGDPSGVVWENERATRTKLGAPKGIALGEDGSLYVVGDKRVRRISRGDRIKTVVGIPRKQDGPPAPPFPPKLREPSSNGLRADEVEIDEGFWAAPAPDGSLWVHDFHGVKRIGPDGRVEPGAGNSVPWNSVPYGGFDVPQPAPAARLDVPGGIDVGPSGEVFISDSSAKRINVVDAGMPRFNGEEIAVPSKDGEEIYKFSKEGRHLETLDALTGGVVLNFSYDGAGRLTSVTDGDGDITELERNAAGDPTAIVSADGDRTPLALGADGLLSRIENPKGEAYRMAYASGGLLASFTDPRNNESTFQYDDLGRLERDDNAAGGFKTLTRSGNRDTYEVKVRTKLGRETTHRVEPNAGGTLRKKTDPAGLVTTTAEGADGATTSTGPDGTVVTTKTQADPRFGTQSAYTSRAEVRTPAGRSRVVETTRATLPPSLSSPTTYQQFEEKTKVNGRTWSTVFDRPSSTFTSTSPAGRSSTTTVNAQRRPLSSSAPGITPTSYSYDLRGRFSASAQGVRTTSVTYDAAGNVDTETDSLGRTTSYDYDAAGRVTQVQLPGGRTVSYAYDDAGNLTSVTPPGRPAHSFAFGPIGLLADYDPPDVAGAALPTTHYTYDDDHNVTQVDRPDRAAPISFDYDNAGRLESTSAPTGTGGATEATSYVYDAVGHLKTVTAPSGEVLTFTDDGPLPLEQKLEGAVAGQVNQSYDAEQRLASETINGGNAVNYTYDSDDLLASVGTLTITRDPVVAGVAQKNGLIASTTLGSIGETRAYNTFGEPVARTFTAGSNQLLATNLTRDDGGRISAKTETTSAGATSYGYVYDAAGRLADSTKTAPGGASTATHYEYDGNGNRTQRTRDGATTYYSYDEHDRLTDAGTLDFTYDANGQLTRRQDSANTSDDMRYGYDAYGQLRDVELADGSDIRYVLDGLGRRVGKKVDGQVTQGFLYSGDQLVAELNPDNTVKSRFVYATRAHVPDYMVKDGVSYRFVTDELGSPRLVVNSATGGVVQELEYDEFGVVSSDSNPGFQPFGYAGGLYDRDTKLAHFGAREYSAEVGRWTAKDPIGFGGGDSNLYGYVFNDPVNLVDPSGLVGWPSLPSFDDVSQAAAGALDATFFNLPSKAFGIDPSSWCSSAYRAGSIMADLNPKGLIKAGVRRSARSIIGNNPRATRNRINTDLPGGRPTAKSIFRSKTKGQKVTDEQLANGGVRRHAPDGTQIRINPDGSTRIDLPHPRGPETIHFDP